MRIAIFGMGYVGIVSAACLARDGHQVIGVDPIEVKVDDINSGRTPISEPGVDEMISIARKNGLLKASTDPEDGIDVDMAWICVGTPSDTDGSVNTSHVATCIRQIAEKLNGSPVRPLIVLRSTVLPGTTAEIVAKELKRVVKPVKAAEISFCFHPEFLRESSAVEDFENPPKIVIGEAHPGDAEKLFQVYREYDAPIFRLSLEEAEMVKYYDNVFHALKITFANEMGQIARSLGVDARRVADVFCSDRKLNISSKYLRPGFAFGGSCLPKDLRAIKRLAVLRNISIPMLQAVQQSNVVQIENFVKRILDKQPSCVGMVGLSFKKDTDDMRESPFVKVAKRLIGEGVELRVFDPGVDPERLIGSNKEAVKKSLKHLKKILVKKESDLNDCDMIIINHRRCEERQLLAWMQKSICLIDIADCGFEALDTKIYEGIAW